MSSLYIVATPIGNLTDISQRALETLKGVDFILCEDTRHTQKLLFHYGIKKPLIAYHQHSCLSKVEQIIDLLRQGKDLALVSDAGTPGISDPGGKLIEAIFSSPLLISPLTNFACKISEGGESRGRMNEGEIKIVPIPGPSAITAIASICGFPMDRFLFLGFPPAKNKRKKFFEEVLGSKYPVIFYESPYRILKTLEELQLLRGTDPRQAGGGPSPASLQVVVGRELTKKFETIYRGTIDEVAKKIKSDSVGSSILGEFVIVIDKNGGETNARSGGTNRSRH